MIQGGIRTDYAVKLKAKSALQPQSLDSQANSIATQVI